MGSFFTLATYRIPLKQDILHTRSYCPTCNNKLKFWDLIPILSYIFLKGKCRYCHDKISPRYIIIEMLSGLFYLLFVISLKIDFLQISYSQIVAIIYGTLVMSAFFIIGGIAKEKCYLSIGTMAFGIIVQGLYITYLYILKINVYRYIIYFILILLLLIISRKIRNNKNKQIISTMCMLIFGVMTTNELVFAVAMLFTCITYLIKKKHENIIFYFSFFSILFLIACNFITNYIYIV